MIINDLDGYYIVFDTKNWNTELDTLPSNLNCKPLATKPLNHSFSIILFFIDYYFNFTYNAIIPQSTYTGRIYNPAYPNAKKLSKIGFEFVPLSTDTDKYRKGIVRKSP